MSFEIVSDLRLVKGYSEDTFGFKIALQKVDFGFYSNEGSAVCNELSNSSS